ncbi:MAG TPA: hypothetical protein VI653_10875 [Steroidobacteraceae bacterium]
MSIRSYRGILTLALLCGTSVSLAADLEAGKAKEQQVCSECHEIGDWKGKSETDLHAKIADIVAGKLKHKKKLQLSDAEIANLAAYISSSSK